MVSGIIIIKIIGIRTWFSLVTRRDVYETKVIGAAKRPIKRVGREDGG